MLVQGSLPPSKKEKSCIIKMGKGWWGGGGGAGEERQRGDRGMCLCMRGGGQRSPATRGFGLEGGGKKHRKMTTNNIRALNIYIFLKVYNFR